MTTLFKVKGENQHNATNSMFIIKLSVSTCFGHHYAHHQENKTVSSTACGVLPGCVGCGLVELRRKLCALCDSYCWLTLSHSSRRSSTRTQPTHPGRTPHAVRHSRILRMMGIMMPETCWDRKFDNKHWSSCILSVLSLFTLKACYSGYSRAVIVRTEI